MAHALVELVAEGQARQATGNNYILRFWLNLKLKVKLCRPLGKVKLPMLWLKSTPKAKL